jgi:hypothetical protein
MTPDRFAALLAAYGGDERRWPADERDAALALIARDPALAAARDDARRLDAELDRHPDPPSVAINPLAITQAARAAASARQTPSGGAGQRLWPRVASLAAAALIGFVVGISGVAHKPASPEADEAWALLFAFAEEDLL